MHLTRSPDATEPAAVQKDMSKRRPCYMFFRNCFAAARTSFFDFGSSKAPRISLVDADLKGLPPTLIINAEIDPLRSDGEMLADKMKAAGDDVTQKTFAGVTHEFFGMAAVVQGAKEAQQQAVIALKKAFGAAS